MSDEERVVHAIRDEDDANIEARLLEAFSAVVDVVVVRRIEQDDQLSQEALKDE